MRSCFNVLSFDNQTGQFLAKIRQFKDCFHFVLQMYKMSTHSLIFVSSHSYIINQIVNYYMLLVYLPCLYGHGMLFFLLRHIENQSFCFSIHVIDGRVIRVILVYFLCKLNYAVVILFLKISKNHYAISKR